METTTKWQEVQQACAEAVSAEYKAQVKCLIAGMMLLQMKEETQHGDFTKLCAEHVEVKPSTYNRWMNAASFYLGSTTFTAISSPEQFFSERVRDDLSLQDAAGMYQMAAEQRRRQEEHDKALADEAIKAMQAREARDRAEEMARKQAAGDATKRDAERAKTAADNADERAAKAKAMAAAAKLRKEMEEREAAERLKREREEKQQQGKAAEERARQAQAERQHREHARKQAEEFAEKMRQAFGGRGPQQQPHVSGAGAIHGALDVLLASDEGRKHVKRFFNSMFHPDSAKFKADGELIGRINNALDKMG